MKTSLVSILFLVLISISNPGRTGHPFELPQGVDALMATWLWGFFTVPASITRDGSPYWYGYPHFKVAKINDPAWSTVAAGHIKSDAKAPAVLMMHGCAGIVRGPAPDRIFFMEKGYAVFEPDSFARPGREPCGGDVLDMRIEELGYALEKIRGLSWVDQERVFLVGVSEGGAAVAAWDQPGFTAHIIVANNCNGNRPHAPEGTPVLAIIGEFDSISEGSGCDVQRSVSGSSSVVIPGGQHDISKMPETEQAIDAFLNFQASS